MGHPPTLLERIGSFGVEDERRTLMTVYDTYHMLLKDETPEKIHEADRSVEFLYEKLLEFIDQAPFQRQKLGADMSAARYMNELYNLASRSLGKDGRYVHDGMEWVVDQLLQLGKSWFRILETGAEPKFPADLKSFYAQYGLKVKDEE